MRYEDTDPEIRSDEEEDILIQCDQCKRSVSVLEVYKYVSSSVCNSCYIANQDYDWSQDEDFYSRWDDDPNPYHGTYSEE